MRGTNPSAAVCATLCAVLAAAGFALLAGCGSDSGTPQADDRYCRQVEDGAGALARSGADPHDLSAGERYTVTRTLGDLAVAAPGSARPVLAVIARGYRQRLRGSLDDRGRERVAAAHRELRTWYAAHCGDHELVAYDNHLGRRP